MSWVDTLINEYRDGRRHLKKMYESLGDNELDKVDKTIINSMIESMMYSIRWMETGRQPDSYKGVDKTNIYRISSYEDMDIFPDITTELKKERKPFYMSREQKQAIMKLFKEFSEREKQCFIMYEGEQLSMQQIANRLGISKSSVQMYIKRAKEKITEIVQ